MNIFHHYCMPGFTNCYTIGKEPEDPDGKNKMEALIIDPGVITSDIINFIENEHYMLLGVLITHNHPNHVNGIRTLKRIYDVDIYASNQSILDYSTNVVKDGDDLNIGSFAINVISTPGHSIDSVVYKISNILFTGDVLSAGIMGKTDSSYGAMRQISMVQNKLFTLHGDFVIFPGHGPPSSLEVERRFNVEPGLYQANRNITRRTEFNLDMMD
ncbi:MAG: hypothetical protein Ta2B_06300 [Termitinemataceae bacterium]|nr:MAG: hypothetical protein Ta2B_06300 [Termitinemataceae bacterium]